MNREIDFLNSILRSFDEIIVVLDLSGYLQYIYQPDQWKLFPETVNISGKRFSELLPAHLSEKIEAAIESFSFSDSQYHTDYSQIIGGEVVWYSVNAAKTISNNDNTGGYTIIVRNITEQMYSEAILRIEHDLEDMSRKKGTPEQNIRKCLMAAVNTPGIDCGGVYEFCSKDNSLSLMTCHGMSKEYVSHTSYYPGDSNLSRMVRRGIPAYVRCGEKRKSKDTMLEKEELRALAYFPVKDNDMLLAVLKVGSVNFDRLPEFTKMALKKISSQIGKSIVHAKHRKEISYIQRDINTLLNSLNDFLFILDMKGNIIHSNKVVWSRLGYKKSDIADKNLLFLYPPEKREDMIENIYRMISENEFECRVPFQKSNGEVIPVETITHKDYWHGSEAVIVISRDISEVVRTNEKLVFLSGQLENGLIRQITLSEIAIELNSNGYFESRIHNTLEKVGVHTDSCRVYILEDNETGASSSVTFEWRSQLIGREERGIKKITYNKVPSLRPILDKESRLYSANINKLPIDLRNLFKTKRIRSIVLYPLLINEDFFGFIGAEEYESEKQWSSARLELLRTVSQLISNAYERRLMEISISNERDKAMRADRHFRI